MKQGKLAAIGIGIVVLALVLFSSVYTVRETEQALILQFGNPVRVVREPGIKFKLPFIQNVEYYEKRILDLDPPVQEVLLVDQKRINVDAFARYRIIDPLRFRQRAVTDSNFRQIFGGRLNSAVRGEVAQADLGDMLSEMRAVIMTRIAETLRKQAPDFGVEVVDLRIGRTDLPEATSQAVYNRMRSDRIAQAAQLRAEGEELKAKIEAEADRDRTVILADAGRQGEILRGEGEATRTRMLSEAYGKDPAFFDFFRSLEAYSALGDSGTTFVLTPDSDFFRFFLNERGTVSPEVPAGEGENQANATP